MELIDALEIIDEHALDLELVHKHYERVTTLARKYKILVTGEEIEELMEQFVQREDEDMFEQRKRLTHTITQALAKSVMNPYNKVARNDKVKKRVEVPDEASQELVDSMINGFYGSSKNQNGLDYYMRTRFVELSFVDPNAWLLVEWEGFDGVDTLPEPRPRIVSSEEAIDFKVENDDTEWILSRNEITYKAYEGVMPNSGDRKEVDKEGHKYVLYAGDITVTYTQVDREWAETNHEFQENESLRAVRKDESASENDTLYFIVAVSAPGMDFVPAWRIGYNRDVWTDSETFVNPFHEAMPYFMKSIKTCSELDLSMALHAFPQKLQYVARCMGTREKPCHNGRCGDGSVCEECGGDGFKIHTSAQDSIILPMPQSKEEMIDLGSIIHYVTPPESLIKFQDEYVKALKPEVHQAVFNSDVFVKTQFAATATEKEMDMDSVYDTLLPFSQRYSALWKDIVRVCFFLADVDEEADGVNLVHAFPADFKLKTTAILLAELKSLNDSEAPSFFKDNLNRQLAEAVYTEDPENMLKYDVKQYFAPFKGKSQDEILMLMESSYVPDASKVLYANFEDIFSEIDREDEAFWTKKPEEQWKIVNAKIEQLQKEIDKAKAEAFSLQNPNFGSGLKPKKPIPGAGNEEEEVEGTEDTGGGQQNIVPKE